MSVYTVGIWTVKPGREDEFVAAWRALGEWTLSEFRGQSTGTLLRDRDVPNRFLSFGPWPDDAALARWRSAKGFGEHVGRIRALLEKFEPGTFDLVAELR